MTKVQSWYACVCVCVCVYAQEHTTLCDPTDCSQPGSSVHGIPQARKLEWVPITDYSLVNRGNNNYIILIYIYVCMFQINHYI